MHPVQAQVGQRNENATPPTVPASAAPVPASAHGCLAEHARVPDAPAKCTGAGAAALGSADVGAFHKDPVWSNPGMVS